MQIKKTFAFLKEFIPSIVMFLLIGMFTSAIQAAPTRKAGVESREESALDLAAAPGDPARGWYFECVDCPKQFDDLTDRSLRLSPDGRPHVAYGGDHLYYAWQGGEWYLETIDPSPGVGQFASLALDQRGYAHISYYDQFNEDLKYAFQDERGWHPETVDSQGNVGKYSSLGIDAQGYSHISYYDQTKGDLKYAVRDNLGWHFEIVDHNSIPQSMALDSDGYAHISYTGTGGLQHAYLDSSGWHIEIVDSEGGGASSIILAPNGFPHISYAQTSCFLWICNGDLRYAFKDANGWRIQIVRDLDDAGSTSISLDNNGHPYISYVEYDLPCSYCSTFITVNYVYQDMDGWHTEGLDSGITGTYFTSLALDADGDPHVMHARVGSFGVLKYTSPVAGNWNTQTIEDHTALDAEHAFILDGSGYPHIAYASSGNSSLLYAGRAGGNWQIEDVISGWGDAGNPSIALSQLKSPSIAYQGVIPQDRTNPGECWIEFASKQTGNWVFERLDHRQAQGCPVAPSLALDQADGAHISYYDYSAEALKYAYRDAPGWVIENIESSTEKITPALALDRAGRAHIAYSAAGNLRYAHQGIAGWEFETIDSGAAQFTSLSLDNSDRPHLSYLDGTNNDLKYAYRDQAGWQIETARQGESGYPSLALDSGDRPHLLFSSSGRLIYAFKGVQGWQFETVRDGVGSFHDNWIHLDENNIPHISYYNDWTGDLIYAYPVDYSEYVYLPLTRRY